MIPQNDGPKKKDTATKPSKTKQFYIVAQSHVVKHNQISLQGQYTNFLEAWRSFLTTLALLVCVAVEVE